MNDSVGMHTSLYDLSPALQLMLLGLLISLIPIAWLADCVPALEGVGLDHLVFDL